MELRRLAINTLDFSVTLGERNHVTNEQFRWPAGHAGQRAIGKVYRVIIDFGILHLPRGGLAAWYKVD